MVSIAAILIMHSHSVAQSKHAGDITIVVPEETIMDIIEDLVPFKFDFGKRFTGSFRIEAIDNLEIDRDKIACSSYIVGEDVAYSIKIIDKSAHVDVGNVRLRNDWEAAVRYDEARKTLLVTPYVRGVIDKGNVSKGEMLLHALLEGMSGLAYPVKLNDLKPIKTVLKKRDLFIDVNITGVSVEKGQIVITMKPSAEYGKTDGPKNQ